MLGWVVEQVLRLGLLEFDGLGLVKGEKVEARRESDGFVANGTYSAALGHWLSGCIVTVGIVGDGSCC